MNTVGIHIDPLDVLFFRDGRPFEAATRGHSGLPTPQVLLGAIRTAMLERFCPEFAKMRSSRCNELWPEFCTTVKAPAWLRDLRIKGPWLARVRDKESLEVLVPVPAVLHQTKEEDADGIRKNVRLNPVRPEAVPGWKDSVAEDQKELWPLWLNMRDATKATEGFLSLKGLKTFLSGGIPDKEDVVSPDDLYGMDVRTGIGINADRLSAEESQIYGASFLALRPGYTARELHEPPNSKPGVALYAEVIPGDGAPNDWIADLVVPFGGEGKRAHITVTEHVNWGEQLPKSAEEKPMLVLTTPGFFQGWRPDALKSCLRAAAVPNPVAVSGWDLAKRGPKPTRFAAPAGSVYLLNSYPDALPDPLCNGEDRSAGWGSYLKGVWIDDQQR